MLATGSVKSGGRRHTSRYCHVIHVLLVSKIAIDQVPSPQKQWTSLEQHWREVLATVPIKRTGMKTEEDEDNLNRFIWHDVKGWKTPYPVKLSGAHGRGLKHLQLVFGDADED